MTAVHDVVNTSSLVETVKVCGGFKETLSFFSSEYRHLVHYNVDTDTHSDTSVVASSFSTDHGGCKNGDANNSGCGSGSNVVAIDTIETTALDWKPAPRPIKLPQVQ